MNLQTVKLQAANRVMPVVGIVCQLLVVICWTRHMIQKGMMCSLFPGSRIPSTHFDTVFMCFVQRHNLTYACQGDLLRLFSMVLPSPNTVPSSSFTFTRQFTDFKKEVLIQRFCGCCLSELNHGSSCGRQQCRTSQERQAVFIRIPLGIQLRDRFQGKKCLK